nr:MAG TPA: tail protein [Caudoviricetes sp.]
MINVSNAFKQGLENGEKVWIEVDITFSDGTSKHLKNEIMNGNNSFSDCAESSSFPIGCVICKSMTLELDNTSDQWKDYYFYMAKVHAYLKMQIDANTVETIDKGVYTITTPEQYGEILSFTALDDMYKTNAVFSTKLVLPQTAESLVRDACGTLSITAGFSKMAHGDLIINELPKDMTYRQLFGWAAMLDTANARLDSNGSLQFVRWNLDTTPSIELKDYINMPTVSSDDIVITGINVMNGDNSETYGTSGYILSMENNLVGESDLATVAAQIGDSIIGAKFRNLQGDMAFNPLLEFGDVAYTYDRNLNQYVTPLTDVSYTVNGKTTVKTQADDPIRGMSLYYSGATKAIVAARQLVEKEKNARELAIEKLQESLSVGSGLFATYVQQEDGSTISYFHDKGTLEESKNVIKITSEAIGVSNDGGKTYPFGFQLTGTMITKLLYAEGINADYINTGALTVRDKNGDIIFQVNMDTNTVYMNPDILIIGDQTLTEKLIAMDNSIAEAKSMTMQLTNDYQSITTDADGNISGTFPTVTTTAQVMYGTNDVTNDCTYTITKSNNVTGSWNDSTHTYTVTGLSADNGWVDIKATYLRALSITKRFTVAKLKAGKNGINGLDGLQGEKGEQGIPGPKGEDGKTSHFHIKYSSVANPTSSSQMTETPSTYIGTYVDYEPNDSTDPKKYTWSKFEGTDGKDGIAGTNGTDGKTYYLHIAYANSADGRTGFSVSDGTNKLYIGQYTDTTKEDSTDPTKYTWSKIKGDPGTDGKPGPDGKPGRTYIIEPSCTVLKRGADKVISPNFLEFNAYYRDGDSATRYAYSGRFVIEETADGNTWKTIYTSSANETSVKHYLYTVLTDSNGQTITDGNGTTVGIPRDVTNIRCKLYAAGGTTNMLDMQSVAVVIDVDNLTQTDIVNILSNNGAWKGLYYKNGQLYISFSAALGGELTLGGKNNGNGALHLYDKDGKLLSILDNRGLLCGYDLRDTNDYFTMPGAPDGYEMHVWDEVGGVLIASQRGVGMRWAANQDNRYALYMLADYEFEVYLNDGVDSTSNPYTPLRCTHDYTEVFNQLKTYNVEQYTNAYTLMLKLDGTVVRSASSAKRYKDVREDIDAQSIEKWYGIQTVWAKYKDGYLSSEDENNGKYMPMFLADDVEQHMPEAAIHMDGKIEDWNYRVMIPAMFAMMKQQKSEIDSLKQELNEIKQLLRKE